LNRRDWKALPTKNPTVKERASAARIPTTAVDISTSTVGAAAQHLTDHLPTVCVRTPRLCLPKSRGTTRTAESNAEPVSFAWDRGLLVSDRRTQRCPEQSPRRCLTTRALHPPRRPVCRKHAGAGHRPTDRRQHHPGSPIVLLRLVVAAAQGHLRAKRLARR
jgi:hypothetical protein